MSVLSRLMPDNPVLTKELRVRMRGARAYWILLGYLGFLSIVMLFNYHGWQDDVLRAGSGGSESSEIGKNLFGILLVCQAFLVLFITPAITSGSITIEKEQQTLDMLTMTRLSRSSMIVGKLLSAVSFTALLIISSLPLVSICFMLGGVDPAMVFSTYLAMLTGSFLIGAIGLMWSSLARSTTIAVMITYMTMLCLGIVLYVVIMGYESLRGNSALGFAGANVFLTAAVGICMTWCSGSIFGMPNVEFLGFAVLSIVTGVLIATIARTRLETWPDRHAGILRIMTAAVFALQTGAVCIWWLATLYGRQVLMGLKSPALGALIVPTILLMLLVPTFATGVLEPYEARQFGKYLLWGWTPKGLRRGKLASGLPFLTLLTVLLLGLYSLTFVVFGKPGDLFTSASLPTQNTAVTAPTAAPPGFTGPIMDASGNTTIYRNGVVISVNGVPAKAIPAAPLPSANASARRGDFPQLALTLLTFVIGFSLLCQFLSIAFRNRWIAWTLACLVLLILVVLPAFSISGVIGGPSWFSINFLYLNPLYLFYDMTDPAAFNWASSNLMFGSTPAWQVTALSWAIIGSLSFLLSLRFVRREAKINRPIPYEEMVHAV